MKTLKIGDKEFVLEYSFAAAEHKECIDKVFKMMSGGYIGKYGLFGDNEPSKAEKAAALVDGTASMFAELPDTVITAFYAGLMENNAVMNKKEAKTLLRQYFKENPDQASFMSMFNTIKECMEEDGFFKLTGLDEMMKRDQAAGDQVKTQS